MEIAIQIVLLATGFVLLIKGANWFVEGASAIADKFGLPQIVIGLTIVAFGTSTPEAAVSIGAALKGNAGLTIGNVIGSNIMNILLILGITAILTPLAIQKYTFRCEIPFVLVITGILLVMGVDDVVMQFEGVILCGLMLVFLIYLIIMSKKGLITVEGTDEEDEGDRKSSIWIMLFSTAAGMAMIVYGSDIVVDNATLIATNFGISDRIIGLTVIAFGTSLPELVTSVIAGLKGKADIAIGNIVGSNIFNILFVLGSAALITDISFAPQFISDTIISMLVTVMLWVFILISKKLKRYAGIIMLAGFVVYFVNLL